MLCDKEEFITQSHLVFSKGIVTITVPDNQPIDIGSTAIINCTPPEDLGKVTWLLTGGDNKTTPITTGIEANVGKDNNTISDNVALSNISESWKGMFLHI